jgi:hypothetical protein
LEIQSREWMYCPHAMEPREVVVVVNTNNVVRGWLSGTRSKTRFLSRFHEIIHFARPFQHIPSVSTTNTNTLDYLLIQVDYLILGFGKTTWLHLRRQRRRPLFRKMNEFFVSITKCSMRQRCWIQDPQKTQHHFNTRSITKDGRIL